MPALNSSSKKINAVEYLKLPEFSFQRMVLTKHHHHRRHLHLYLHLHFPFCTWKIRAKLSCYMWKASLSSKTPQKRKSLLLCHRPMPSSSMCFCVHKKVTKGYFLFQEKYTGASTKAAYIDCVSPEHRT